MAKLGADRIYQTTGIQFMPLNTLYSLYAHKQADPHAFAAADQLLFIPDLFHYWLSGERTVEATIASTSQMIDCHTGDWARDMLAELGLPTNILGRTTPPGTTIGKLRAKMAEETGLPTIAASRRARRPRHGERRCRRAGERASDELVLSIERHLVVARRGTCQTVRHRRGPSGFVHERARRRRHVPLSEEHRRPVARAGMPPRLHAKARNSITSRSRKLASEAAPLRTIVDPAHASFQIPGGMLEKSATSPAARANRCQLRPASSFAPRSKASRWLIAKSWRRSNRSSSGASTRFTSSAAAARMRCSTK